MEKQEIKLQLIEILNTNHILTSTVNAMQEGFFDKFSNLVDYVAEKVQ